MPKTVTVTRCLNCGEVLEKVDKRTKFCNCSCAVSYNNKKRKLSKSAKKKISKSLKAHFDRHPKKVKEEYFWAGVKTSKGRHLKNPQNLFELSSRTRTKVLRRLGLPCFLCGWSQEICDVHHIKGRAVEDCHDHNNLTNLCPNCHRLAHVGKIDSSILPTLEERIGDRWKREYYG
jgi:hypothetical protein